MFLSVRRLHLGKSKTGYLKLERHSKDSARSTSGTNIHVKEPRKFDGSEFQSLGAAFMKLRSQYDTDLIFVGITNEVASFFDLKFRLALKQRKKTKMWHDEQTTNDRVIDDIESEEFHKHRNTSRTRVESLPIPKANAPAVLWKAV
ncbi:hypothetical protein DPMN_056470 [Dreissena polymorpha]|uniref:Uncharacterized protein n=1 Tax=Dreissena polymorpha TaxID=45954 RepID=A0A9D4HTI6_DREPO|nr:hypothetical protein DPMN_056470 [Dreissena polymorpha]